MPANPPATGTAKAPASSPVASAAPDSSAGGAASVPVPSGATEHAMACTEVFVNKDAVVEAAREDLKVLMHVDLQNLIDTAVEKHLQASLVL